MIDYITGNKFKALCESVWGETDIKPNGTLFCKTDYIFDCFKAIESKPGPYVLVTHNSDIDLTQEIVYRKPQNVKKWFGQNMCVYRQDLQAIPIGIANPEWPHGNFSVIENQLQKYRQLTNLALMCFNVSTRPDERISIYRALSRFDWVTTTSPNGGLTHEQYIENVYKHQFIISPRGNGIDCLRTWEALYLGAIPVIERSEWSRYFEDMPIIITNDLERVSAIELFNGYLRIMCSKAFYTTWKLIMPYWKREIEEALHG